LLEKGSLVSVVIRIWMDGTQLASDVRTASVRQCSHVLSTQSSFFQLRLLFRLRFLPSMPVLPPASAFLLSLMTGDVSPSSLRRCRRGGDGAQKASSGARCDRWRWALRFEGTVDERVKFLFGGERNVAVVVVVIALAPNSLDERGDCESAMSGPSSSEDTQHLELRRRKRGEIPCVVRFARVYRGARRC
jgi:hypothetical protein